MKPGLSNTGTHTLNHQPVSLTPKGRSHWHNEHDGTFYTRQVPQETKSQTPCYFICNYLGARQSRPSQDRVLEEPVGGGLAVL